MPDNSAFGVAQPEVAQTFEQWFSENYPTMNGNPYGYDTPFFAGFYKNVKNQYDTYLQNLNSMNEYRSTQAANQWSAKREDTATQRLVHDLESAGLNPYMLLSGGSGIGTPQVSSANRASYGYKQSSDDRRGSDNGRNAALVLLALARLVAALV